MALANVVAELVRVFPPHAIDPDAAFSEWGGTHVDANVFRDGVRGKQWTDLDPAFLEHHHDALVFLGPTSIRDYLPAYVSALVRRDPALSSMPGFLLGILTREEHDPRFEQRFSHLTAGQRRAIAHALAAYEADVMGTPRQADVSAALDSYWRAQIGGV